MRDTQWYQDHSERTRARELNYKISFNYQFKAIAYARIYHLNCLYVIVGLLGYTFPHMFLNNFHSIAQVVTFLYVWALCAPAYR